MSQCCDKIYENLGASFRRKLNCIICNRREKRSPQYLCVKKPLVNDRGNGSRSYHIRILLHISKLKQMSTANPFNSTVKAGRKLVTPSYILITKGKNSVTYATVLKLKQMSTANPFNSTVKAGRKLVTPSYILITKGKNSVTYATVLVAISSPDLP